MTWGRCRDKRNHICGESFCKNCQQYYTDDHKCYMHSTVVDEVTDMKEDEREGMELLGHDISHSPWGKHFIFYDFESMQEGEGEHVPNLVVAHSICDKCGDMMHVTPISTCVSCDS